MISDEYNTKSKHNSQDEKSSDNEKKSINIVKDAEVKLNSLKPGMGIVMYYRLNNFYKVAFRPFNSGPFDVLTDSILSAVW